MHLESKGTKIKKFACSMLAGRRPVAGGRRPAGRRPAGRPGGQAAGPPALWLAMPTFVFFFLVFDSKARTN